MEKHGHLPKPTKDGKKLVCTVCGAWAGVTIKDRVRKLIVFNTGMSCKEALKINNALLVAQSPEDKADLELAKKVLSIMESMETSWLTRKQAAGISWLFNIERVGKKEQHSAVAECFPIVHEYITPTMHVLSTYYPKSMYLGEIQYHDNAVLGERKFESVERIAQAIRVVRLVHEEAARNKKSMAKMKKELG